MSDADTFVFDHNTRNRYKGLCTDFISASYWLWSGGFAFGILMILILWHRWLAYPITPEERIKEAGAATAAAGDTYNYGTVQEEGVPIAAAQEVDGAYTEGGKLTYGAVTLA